MSIAVHADWSAGPPLTSTENQFVVLSEKRLREDASARNRIDVLVDARLDNEVELKRDLNLPGTSTSSEIFRAAYLRWGDSFAEHVAGDFAAALWDGERRRIVAVRDPFGVRSLFYRRSASAVWIATDQRTIIETLPGAPAIDDYAVVEHLLGIYRSTERTFFGDIRRLSPGHVLTFDGRALNVARYWNPPQVANDRVHAEPTREHLEEFTRLFKRSIANRLDHASAAVVHVSGGVDSSSVAIACDLLRREGRPLPRLIGGSASYPGLSCDESAYVAAVEGIIGFPVERWDGTASVASDLTDPAVDFPTARSAFTDGTHGDLALANRVDAQVILCGTGGDELTVGLGTVRDMLAKREWLRATKRLFFYAERDSTSMLGRLKTLAVQYLPAPVEVRRIRSHIAAPDWLNPAFEPLVRQIIWPSQSSASGSRAASSIWDRIASGQLVRSVEFLQRQALPFGVEYRFPFLDRDLVTFVVSIAAGYWPVRVRPHQRALGNDLPASVAKRFSKADLTAAFVNRIARAAPAIERQFSDSVWASQKYVSRETALSAWRRLEATNTDGHLCRQLWGMVTLEAWLRRVLGYSVPTQREGRA